MRTRHIVLFVAFAILIAAKYWLRSADSDRPPPTMTPVIVRPRPANAKILRIVSARDGRALAGAQVRCQVREASTPVLRQEVVASEEDGRAWLDPGVTGALIVLAQGHVGITRSASLDDPMTTISLDPSGALQLRIRRNEKPVEGIEAELLLEGNPAEPTEGAARLWGTPLWRRSSDRDGNILWPELLPGRSYRCRIHSRQPVSFDDGPKQSVHEYDPTPDPSSTSAPVPVRGGETADVRAALRSGSAVQGILIGGSSGISGSIVRLYHKTAAIDSKGNPLGYQIDLESVVSADAQGSFRFPKVHSGQKRIAAQWKSGRNHLFVVSLDFDLLPDQDRDLGVLRAQEGQTVQVTVQLEGAEALPAPVRQAGLRAELRHAGMRAMPAGIAVYDKTLVGIGEPTFIHGVSGGELRLFARLWEEPDGFRWNNPEESVPIPGTDRVDLTIQAIPLVSGRILAAFPAGQPKVPVRAVFYPEADSEDSEMVTLDDSKDGPPEAPFRVPVGKYVVWMVPDTTAGEVAANWFGEAAVEVVAGKNNEIRVSMGEGAILRGQAFDPGGKPYRRLLTFHASPKDRSGDPKLWTARPDGGGTFVLKGVPPGRTLSLREFEPDCKVGAAGSETFVTLKQSN